MSRVSVIIPAFNQAAYLPQSVDSMLTQSHADLDVIVVDDGSTDDTPEVCRTLTRDSRVRVIRQSNRGVSEARNRGVSEATGDYVCFLDADDWCTADKIEKQVAQLDRDPSLDFVYCDVIEVDETGAPLTRGYSVGAVRTTLHGDLTESLALGGYFPLHAVMVRRSALDTVGGFDPALGGHADLDVWLRLAAAGFRAEYLDERLVYYRLHAQGMSRDFSHMRQTREGAYAKLAAADPVRAGAAIVALQQRTEDVHLANEWLSARVESLTEDTRGVDGVRWPLIDALAATGKESMSKRPEIWEVAIDGRSHRAIVLHPPASERIVIPYSGAGRLEGAVALHPDVWNRIGSGGCRFALSVDQRVEWTCVLEPGVRAGDRRWVSFVLEIPAGDADHEIVLATEGLGGREYRWALWRAPMFIADC